MAFSKAVQFRGISNVVKAYTNKAVPRWGLFQGTQFLEKYEGDDLDEGKTLLRDYLEALDQRSNDSNTYTLCVYEDPGKITSASKYDASFNFRLMDTIEDHLQSKMTGVYEQRIAGLEQKIAELTMPEEDERDPKQPLWDALGKILEHPQVQQTIITKALSLVDGLTGAVTGMFTPKQPAQPQGEPAKVRAISGTAEQDENQKLQQAVNILAVIDPALGTHLLKLAEISQKDPAKYQLLIGMLKTM